ncbi:unnamed protein product [Notodromas monacha]|uniref:Uncharacterized protein n=1 Tax=Notodromas monacha TaxID=399045 RepID=A0A7R9GC28_9CRUS|nr:unnamed protein product [Notodromas monacha]CAG0917044.1 unnamed protein product [Notodromas monacha]
MSLLSSVINRLCRGQPDSPFQVVEMKEHAYADRLVRMREDCLVLYASIPNAGGSNNETVVVAATDPSTTGAVGAASSGTTTTTTSSMIAAPVQPPVLYEVVLHKPIHAKDGWKAFSLVRVHEEQVAEAEFNLYKTKFPILMAGYPGLFTVRFLERMLELIHKHPTWTLAHLAAEMDVPEAFSLPAVQAMINEQDEDSECALHVAVKRQSLRSVEAMMTCEPRLDVRDSKGSTVFHMAALSNERIIATLARADSPAVNTTNDAGYSPLHLACMADKPECVKALLVCGADVNSMAIRPPGDYKPIDSHGPAAHEPRLVVDLTGPKSNRSTPSPPPTPPPALTAKDILTQYPRQFDNTLEICEVLVVILAGVFIEKFASTLFWGGKLSLCVSAFW